MRLFNARISIRRMLGFVLLLGIVIAGFKHTTDPLETFYDRTDLGRTFEAKVVSTRRGTTFHGEPEFAVVFDADPGVVKGWLSKSPPQGWRGWKSGLIPLWITGMCPVARRILEDFPIQESESTTFFAFRHSPIHDHDGDLIVIDKSIGRVWYLSWGY